MDLIQRDCDSIRNHTKQLTDMGVAFKRVGNEPAGMELTERAKLINHLVSDIEKQNVKLIEENAKLIEEQAANTPEALWKRFIDHLNETQPLRAGPEHKNFLGSVESYRKVFMEANSNEHKS